MLARTERSIDGLLAELSQFPTSGVNVNIAILKFTMRAGENRKSTMSGLHEANSAVRDGALVLRIEGPTVCRRGVEASWYSPPSHFFKLGMRGGLQTL